MFMAHNVMHLAFLRLRGMRALSLQQAQQKVTAPMVIYTSRLFTIMKQ